MPNYVVWSQEEEDRRGFVESVGHNGIFFTLDIDQAFQFTDEEDAQGVAEMLEEAVVLEWN